MSEFQNWCRDVRQRYERAFSHKPNATPDLAFPDSIVVERVMRCAIEAQFFGVDEHDDLMILAHHTLLLDALRRPMTNNRTLLYGYQ